MKEGSVAAWAGHATYGNYLGSVTVCYGTMSASRGSRELYSVPSSRSDIVSVSSQGEYFGHIRFLGGGGY